MWFDRRTNYTRSLAVMSMVGYVLGLGDRYVCVCVYYHVICDVYFCLFYYSSLLLSSCFVSFSSFSSLCRHPSNLMLDRLTGRILHIDFGDCFEVAMTREKFPEKIPFRLTRMLTNAMEVSNNTYMW